MAVITKRKNNFKSKSSMKTKRSSKSKSNSKTRKQFKNIRKNGMGTRKMMRGGGKRKRKTEPQKKPETYNPLKVNRTPENHAILNFLQDKYNNPNLTFAEITQTSKQRQKIINEIKKQKIQQEKQKKRKNHMLQEIIGRVVELSTNKGVKPSLMRFSPKLNPQQITL